MAGLPPRPDFTDPPSVSRSDSRLHYYGGRPPPPEHYRERERERDVYLSGRSPPRRHSSRPLADSYVAPDRDRERASYPPRDAYPPPYDRREHDERHRERGWERREYRDYPPPPPPPPHADFRFREPDPRGDPRTWAAREPREGPRARYEEPRGAVVVLGARKSPPRSWTQSDEIDRHPRGGRYREAPREPAPREEGRRWQPRPGLSPPRRFMGNTPPHASSSSQYPRSPRRRSPSPGSAKVPSPRRRSSREPPDMRPSDVPYMSRRREEPPPRRDYRSRSRGPRRRSRSRSASPPRRRPPSASPVHRKETREETLSPGRILEEGEREPSPKRREPPPVIQSRREPPPSQPNPTPRAPAASRPMDTDRRHQERLPTLKVDAPPKNDKPSREPESAKATSAGSATPQKAESSSRPRSPSLLQQRGITKTPTTPMSPAGRSPAVPPPSTLPAKPATPQAEPEAPAASTPTESPMETVRTIKQKLHTEFGLGYGDIDHGPLPWQNDEVTRLKAHQLRIEQEYYDAARVARQALYDLDMTKLELAAAGTRRDLAVKQAQLALHGKAGIDWPYDWESLDPRAKS